jgi:hypothetical protein
MKTTRTCTFVLKATLVGTGLCLFGISAAVAQSGSVLTVVEGRSFSGKINGTPVTFNVAADGLSYLVLNRDTAQQLRLRSNIFPIEARIGPTRFKGKTGIVSAELAGVTDPRRRVLWFDRPVTRSTDGTIGPDALPQEVVRFELRSPSAG